MPLEKTSAADSKPSATAEVELAFIPIHILAIASNPLAAMPISAKRCAGCSLMLILAQNRLCHGMSIDPNRKYNWFKPTAMAIDRTPGSCSRPIWEPEQQQDAQCLHNCSHFTYWEQSTIYQPGIGHFSLGAPPGPQGCPCHLCGMRRLFCFPSNEVPRRQSLFAPR